MPVDARPPRPVPKQLGGTDKNIGEEKEKEKDKFRLIEAEYTTSDSDTKRERKHMPNAKRDKKRIERHIDNLNSPDENVSSRAKSYLIRYYGSKALEQLAEACQHTNPVVRYRSVWALAHTREPRAYKTILRLTDDPDERVRYDATIALGILGDERAIEPLTRIFLNNDATRPAGMAFSRMGLKTVPALIQILHQGSPDVRWSVVQVLGNFAEEFGDVRCIALLQACVSDPTPIVREDAQFWLREVGKSTL